MRLDSSATSLYLRPMKRLAENTVLAGFVTACRLAASPTSLSPFLANATTDGVVRLPSEFSNTVASPPSITAMHEFVVPKSMPKILPILFFQNCAKAQLFASLKQPECHTCISVKSRHSPKKHIIIVGHCALMALLGCLWK